MTAEIDVTECPECAQKGHYEYRVLVGGRGYYQCPDGHRWQDAWEKPTTKGVAYLPAPHNHADQCCREHGTHSSPHIGCILR